MANIPGTPWSNQIVPPVAAPAPVPVAPAPTPAPAPAPAAGSSPTIPFDVTAYLKQHPEIAENYASGTTPDGKTYQQVYGSLANYAATNALRNGGPDLAAAIRANNFVLPSGTTASLDANGNVNFSGGTGLSDNTLMAGLGYESQGGTNTPSTPLEQQILSTSLPEIQNEILGDTNRRSIADNLANQTLAGASAANAQLQRTQGGHFDGTTYFQKYPDVAAAYQAAGGQSGTGKTVDQYAEQHYLTNGQKEGRSPYYVQSSQLAQDFNNANQTTAANIAASADATKSQLQALSQATTQMQQNLTGDLATKASALQQQITSLQQNAGNLDAAQRAALLQQIQTQQQDLVQSVSAQKQAADTAAGTLRTAASTNAQNQLSNLAQSVTQLQANLSGESATKAAALSAQLASLNQNLDTLDASQRAALTQQITTQIQDLHDSIGTQRQALQDQITALGTAADAQSQAKLASLNQEIQGLTAAQAPLNAARLAAADMQATAVNTGLESTKDQLTAQSALAGYYGGSTGQDAALARATISARQNAAQAVGGAQTANATDTRDIGIQGAAGQKTIADALADAHNQIAGQAATGTAGLTVGQALGTEQLKDTQATGLSGIASNTALSRAGIGAQGANTTFADALNAAAQNRSINDNAATTAQKIKDALSAQGFQIDSTQTAQIQNLSNQLASGQQNLGDTQAAGLAGIATNTAQSLSNIGNLGATTTYGNVAAGADQSRTIADALAQGNYGINAGNAAQTLAAQQAGNAAKATYYDNNYNRSLAAALAPASIASSTAGALTGLDQYATSGLNGALNTLNWWSTNTGTPPTPGAIATQPSTQGNSLSNLGSGLLSAGIGIGNANNWWQTPKASSPTNLTDSDITAALGACWIARSVYGSMNPRWLQFRGWMLAQAPAWFRKFYLENGERVAAQITDRQSLKDELRAVMDMILQTA